MVEADLREGCTSGNVTLGNAEHILTFSSHDIDGTGGGVEAIPIGTLAGRKLDLGSGVHQQTLRKRHRYQCHCNAKSKEFFHNTFILVDNEFSGAKILHFSEITLEYPYF